VIGAGIWPWAVALLPGLVVACGGDDGGGGDDDGHDAALAIDASSDPPDAAPDAAPLDAAAAVLPEELPDPLPDGPAAATLLTYNVALLQTIKNNEERKPLIVDALRAADADVMCLQEVWDLYTSPAELAALLSEQFPYAWWSWIGDANFGNGVVIVSRHPLYRGRILRYEANDATGFVDRVLLGVDVVTDTSHFHVLCTHLEAFDPEARSAEIDEVVAYAEAEGYLDGPTFFLGDMNAGPEVGKSCGGCSEIDVASYDKLLETWADARAGNQECTWCEDVWVPLQLFPPPGDQYANQRIDHCLTRGLGASVLLDSETVFDDPVTYDVDGEPVTTYRSDHFGVRCTFGVAE
jgi:endonuclease/exonuclease/phosphatase family metal-dependent hydrolase